MSSKEQPYYVGIGASAGGLEALETFFKHMKDDVNIVFIVIQHLLTPPHRIVQIESGE